jgi:hypothetical protein
VPDGVTVVLVGATPAAIGAGVLSTESPPHPAPPIATAMAATIQRALFVNVGLLCRDCFVLHSQGLTVP